MDYIQQQRKMYIKPKKSEKQIAKERRAKKKSQPRFYRHEMIPVWTEVYCYAQDYSCEPGYWEDIYDDTDWMPCKECNWCKGIEVEFYPAGFDEIEFQLAKFF